MLAFERKKIPGSWQFPQGGLDEGESLLEGVTREIREETGIDESHLELLEIVPDWLVYELPEELRKKKTGRGQAQKWFLFRFTGTEDDITLGDGKEFRAWEWVSMETLISRVVDFKKPIYLQVETFFKRYINQ